MDVESRISAPFVPNEAEAQSDAVYNDWKIAEVLWRIFRDAGDLCHESLMGLAELEISYYRCNFDVAFEKATQLIEHAEAPIALHARVVRMITSIARGDSNAAYKDLSVLKDDCVRGMAQREDDQLFTSSIVSAMRVENAVMATFFKFPDLTEGIGEIPAGLKLYFGYILAQRFLRFNRYEEAAGIAYAHLTVLSKQFPGSRTYLYLIEAASDLLCGNLERARNRFDKAWKLKEEYGILMPFIELNYALLGLPRINREVMADPRETKRVDAMVGTFHKGWYGLRRKCGLPCRMESLTTLESNVCGLVTLGWRNKEIARHMMLSENTVKHQLTSVYQKLGISNRTELAAIYYAAMSGSDEFGVWA